MIPLKPITKTGNIFVKDRFNKWVYVMFAEEAKMKKSWKNLIGF